MPVLAVVTAELARTRPLAGHRIAACLHVTTETANLCRALVAGGAELALCASNPLSTRDDVAAAIHEELGAAVFAVRGADRDTFHRQVDGVLARRRRCSWSSASAGAAAGWPRGPAAWGPGWWCARSIRGAPWRR